MLRDQNAQTTSGQLRFGQGDMNKLPPSDLIQESDGAEEPNTEILQDHLPHEFD
jgi:hypothetical protein